LTASSAIPAATAIDDILANHAGQPGALLPILHEIQHRFGHVAPELVPAIAQALNLSRADVHGVISFYHHFRSRPGGRHVVQVCRAEACQAVHGQRTEEHAMARLGIGFGGTTSDGRFSLEPVFCLGNCAAGPSVMIDETIYGRVTPERLDELLSSWRSRS
jgi:formate dehydrogenase subunit gamma